MRFHPFKPLIFENTRKLLIGTLPPERATSYFSNSSNTRLWDILYAISKETMFIGKGGNELSEQTKSEILNKLEIGISDIIYGYERDYYDSTKDKHINPKRYNDILQLAIENNVTELIFVYDSALKWFIHSVENNIPVRLSKIKLRYRIGSQQDIIFQDRVIKCALLPSPLNRGRLGETLLFKLEFYRKFILSAVPIER